jgi:hypothetical protein
MKIFCTVVLWLLSLSHVLLAEEATNVIHWSNYTNGVRVGFAIETNVMGSRCAVFTQVTGTNFDRLWLPPVKDMIKIELRDGKSNQVQKTQSGKTFGVRNPAQVFAGILPRRSIIYSGKPSIVADVNLQELFIITNSEKYTISVQIRLLRLKSTPGKTSVRENFVFPPIGADMLLVPVLNRRN